MSGKYLLVSCYIAGSLGYYCSFGIVGTEHYRHIVQIIYGKERTAGVNLYMLPIAESLLHPVSIFFLFFTNRKWRITDWIYSKSDGN